MRTLNLSSKFLPASLVIKVKSEFFIFIFFNRTSYYLNYTLKKEILLALGKTPIIKDRKLFIESNEWLVPIKNSYPALQEEYQGLEIAKNSISKAKTEALESIKERWLRDLGSDQESSAPKADVLPLHHPAI